MFGRRRFGDLVRMQLDLFAGDEASLLEEASEADAAWTKADAEQSEELYGDYQLTIEAATDRLAELRDTFARSLEEDDAEQYVGEFNRSVVDRWRELALTIEES